MSKKIFVPIVLSLVALLVLTGCFHKKEEKAVQQGSGVTIEDEERISGSIEDLFKKGKPLKCSFSGEDEGVKLSGQMWVADKRARQDMQSEKDGVEEETHVIVDDKWTYFWTSMEPGKGIKMEIKESDEEVMELGKDIKQEQKKIDEVKEVFDYRCTSWQVDESKFEPPKDIEFVDLAAMFEGMMAPLDEMGDDLESDSGESMDDLKKMMCGTCDSVPDPEECRANLGC